MKGFPQQNDHILRGHFKRDGTPKKKLTEGQAKAMQRRTRAAAYACDFCDGWHIASPKAKKK